MQIVFENAFFTEITKKDKNESISLGRFSFVVFKFGLYNNSILSNYLTALSHKFGAHLPTCQKLNSIGTKINNHIHLIVINLPRLLQ